MKNSSKFGIQNIISIMPRPPFYPNIIRFGTQALAWDNPWLAKPLHTNVAYFNICTYYFSLFIKDGWINPELNSSGWKYEYPRRAPRFNLHSLPLLSRTTQIYSLLIYKKILSLHLLLYIKETMRIRETMLQTVSFLRDFTIVLLGRRVVCDIYLNF